MSKVLNEFKKFAIQGNMLDMAVGMIIGAAFKDLVNSVVKNLITPFVGMFTGKVDFSNMFISVLRNFIPSKVRIPAYVVIIATFVTMAELFLEAYAYSLYESLGVFIPLIVVNCIILARAEAFASKNNPLYSALDGLAMGLGFTGALVIISAIREILGSGTILGLARFGEGFQPALIVSAAPGGFITLGLVLGFFNWISKVRGGKKE